MRVPNSVRVLLIEKYISAAIYNTYSTGRICTIRDE
jgi:hypothetical protein